MRNSDAERGHRLAKLGSDYVREGYALLAGLLSPDECSAIVSAVDQHRERMIHVDIDSLIGRSKFETINGEELVELFPFVRRLSSELCAVASQIEGREVAPLENDRIGLRLNVTPPGGTLPGTTIETS